MLRFYFGVMGSSKTAMLLMQRYNYRMQGFSCALVKPSVDTRQDANVVHSRIGLQGHADIILGPEHSIREQLLWLETRRPTTLQHVFVDEAQFLSESQVVELANMSKDVEIHCYGLKTDFRGEFFPGSSALLRFADTFSELDQSLCWCGAKATMNARVDSRGQIVREGEQVLIDKQGEPITYIGLCYGHWRDGKSGLCGNR
ncbi:thymidine kinase [Eubacteriales bacterium OttesenSCG-928-A19]|nr:thymidine kinase [Eubacteriales bacterium OttesenSCG-928-A19]